MVNVDELLEVHRMNIDRNTIPFTDTGKWCQLPYPNHRKGCPNYGKNPLCPPLLSQDPKILDKWDEFVLIYAVLDFKTYLEQMKTLHPEWSERQLRNPLYWQGSVKKHLRHAVVRECLNYREPFDFLGAGSGFKNKPSIEAIGVNVMEMYKLNGIDFETKPETKVVMSCLVMRKKGNKSLADIKENKK